MSRTRLRGIELAGTRMGVEVPAGSNWSWPAGRYDDFVCAPEGAEVYVGVRVGAAPVLPRDAFVYENRTHRFEVAERGDGWIVAIHGPDGLERTALFDESFSEGEVILSPAAASDGIAPLEHPLDELIVLHRTVRAGGLVLRGSVVVRNDRALLFLGGTSPVGEGGRRLSWQQPGAQRLTGQRVVVLPTLEGVRAVGSPWSHSVDAPGAFSARIDAMHSIRPAPAVFADRLSPDDAVNEVLAQALVPIHDPMCADRCFDAAAGITSRLPVVRLGLPEEKRVVPFTWGRTDTEVAFAPPFVN